MPLSVEYARKMLNKIARSADVAKDDINSFVKVPLQEKFYLAKLLLPELEQALLYAVNKKIINKAVSAMCEALENYKEASHNDYVYLFENAPAIVLYNFILFNKNVPIEFWIEEVYYERFKESSQFKAFKEFRMDTIYVKRRSEAVEYLRKKIHGNGSKIDVLNDEMIFKVMGVLL